MKFRFLKYCLTFLLFIFMAKTYAQKSIAFEVLTGPVLNLPSPLTIKQEGYETLKIKARYVSEPFKLPPYYDIRLSLWNKNKKAWGLKFTHHKLILTNLTPEIQHFEISHGYNIFSITRCWQTKYFTWNLAGGAIIANPDNSVRYQRFQGGGLFNNGYYLSGYIIEGAIGKRFKIYKNLFINAEIRFTGAWAKVKISNGSATVPNTAFHFLFGPGYNFNLKKKNKAEN